MTEELAEKLTNEPAAEVEPRILVRLSPDLMTGFLTLMPGITAAYPFTVEEIVESLSRAGINTGIQLDQIEEIVAKELYGEKLVVAIGTPPINGEDAKITYHFDPSPTAAPLDLDKQIDWREISQIQNVEKGQILAEKTPPTKGVDGVNLKGRPETARTGIDRPLVPGKGMDYAPDNPLQLVAKTSGSVRLNKTESREQVVVENLLVVNKNVDYSTGNIVFDGAVRIKGDLLPGFKVKATGDVQVGGCVERGSVDSGGSVLVLAGIFGAGGQVEVKAKGNVAARFADGAKITAGNDILIKDEALNCEMEAKGSVVVGASGTMRGRMIGGSAKAIKSIQIRNVGSPSVTTKLELAGEESQQEALQEIAENISKLEAALIEVEQKLSKIARDKASGKEQSQQVASMVQKLMELHDQVAKHLEASKQEAIRLERVVKSEKEPTIVIPGTLVAGTEVTIGKQTRRFAEDYQSVRLVLSSDHHSIIAIGKQKD